MNAQQQQLVGAPAPNETFLPDSTARYPLGIALDFASAAWGPAEYIYVQAGEALTTGDLVQVDANSVATKVAASAANTGAPINVARAPAASGNFLWVQSRGRAPVKGASTVGAVFTGGTAGTATSTAANGRQILSARCVAASTGNFTRTIRTQNGSNRVSVPDVQGMFVGMAISGTGIPGSTTVTGLDAGGMSITISNNATAGGQVTGTFTYTGFGIVDLRYPFIQGQVT